MINNEDEKEKAKLFDLVSEFAKCAESLPAKIVKSKKFAKYKDSLLQAFAPAPYSTTGQSLFHLGLNILIDDPLNNDKSKTPPELAQFAYDCADRGFNRMPEDVIEPSYLYGYGEILMMQGRYSEASEYFEQFLENDHDPMVEDLSSYAEASIAKCCLNMGQFEEARKHAKKSIMIELERNIAYGEPSPKLVAAINEIAQTDVPVMEIFLAAEKGVDAKKNARRIELASGPRL